MPGALLIGLVLAASPPAPPAEPLPPVEEARRDALARFGVGVLRARDDRPVEAVKQFEAAAKADPAAAAPLVPLVALYTELGRDPAAVRTAEPVLRLDPADADTAHTLGQSLFEAKRFADAARRLKQAADSPRLADRPAKRLGVLRDLAKASDAAGDPAGAEAALRTAAEFVGTHRDALLRTANFPTAAELDRETAVIQEKLGAALVAGKKFDEAEKAFAAAAALFADPARANAPQAAARLEWNRSDVAAGRGDAAAAVDHLLNFLRRKPTSPEPYERLAGRMREAGRGPAVVALLGRLADAAPTVPAVRWVQAAEVGRAEPARANALFRAAAAGTADPAFYRVAVRHYREANRPADLLALIDDAHRAARAGGATDDDAPRPPGKKPAAADPEAVARVRALTAAVRADAEAGRQLVRFAAAAGATDHPDDTWELLDSLAERDGRLDLAERAARQAWTARRGNDMAGFRRVYELLTRQRKWPDALDVCDHAGGAAANYYRAMPLAELGRAAEALAAIDTAIGNPNLSDTYGARLHRARVLNVLGRHKEAAAECRDAMKAAPAYSDVRRGRYVLSEALLGLKDQAGAEAELRAVLDDDPDDVLALNNLGYNLADQGRKLDEAEELVRRAMGVDRDTRARAGSPEADSGVYLDSLGWVLFRRGKLADARAALEGAVARPDSGADAVVWDHLGDVAFRQGDAGRAREAWAKAVELYANSHQGRQADRRAEATRKLKLVP